MKAKKGTFKLCLFFLFSIVIGCSDNPSEPTDPSPDPAPNTQAQKIVLNAEDYQQEFIGGGVSIGLFLGHHYSMNQTAQDEAVKLIAKDCNMRFFQDYIEIYPQDDPAYFDRRANYLKAAKKYQPEFKFSLVGNKFPKDLMHKVVVNGETFQALNTDDPKIYDRLANWWFKLFEGFYERGVSVEILNVVNEPDLNRPFRKHHYGLNGNTKEAVARIFKYAVPKFKEMLRDPNKNTLNMKIPLIMGPSTISPNGYLEYTQYFKSKYPDVWEEIDIISTHQYINGAKPELFKEIVKEADGKAFYQSETHALKGDALNWNSIYASRSLKAALSLSNLFSTAVNNGVNAWFYFETNYPNKEVHPGGLLSIPWAAKKPIPYKHYYVFRELTSAQPAFSNVISYTMENKPGTQIVAFRKKGQDTIYANYSNYNTIPVDIALSVKGKSDNLKISGYTLTTTSASDNGAQLEDITYENPKDSVIITTKSLSVNNIKLVLSD